MHSVFVLSLFCFIGSCLAQGPSGPGDVVGKLTVGYQGWFAAQGDGSPRNQWVHWGNPPSPGHVTFELYPDMREYPIQYQTSMGNYGNGQPSKLFSCWDNSTIDLHFKWMQQYGIETAALQRFASSVKTNPTSARQLNGIASRVRASAERYGRKFYIMYDVSGWTNFSTELIEDLDTNLRNNLHIFDSPAYARQNGKVVICIWGLGFRGRPDNPSGSLSVVNELKRRGCYVIGGVPKQWRTGNGGSLPTYFNVYTAFHMLSPWMVGSFNSVQGAKDQQAILRADLDLCRNRSIDYQPVLFPGSAWSNWNTGPRNEIPRLHGDFMWQQFVNLREVGIKNAYVAMYDEYDEGTAIAKAAEDTSMIPNNQYFLTLDADGVHVSSDFYLRLVGAGTNMMKGNTPIQQSHSVPFTNPTPGARIALTDNRSNRSTGNNGSNNGGNTGGLLTTLVATLRSLLTSLV